MADPFDKVTRSQSGSGSAVVTEFAIPSKAKVPGTGILGSGVGPTIKAGESEVDATVRIKVRANGDIEFWQEIPGQDPTRVVPTPQELAYVKEMLASRKEAAAPEKAAPTPAAGLEDIRDPASGRVVKKRDPSTGTVIDLPDPPAPRAPEPTVRTGRTVTIGPEGQQGPEVVTKTQFDADRQIASDQRQAALDLQARAQAAESAARDQARLRIEQEKWTADQAMAAYQKDLDKIRLELQKESMALTRRSQDITLRGQDVSAGVAQRGQDLDFQGGLVRDATSLATAMLPNFAQPEQWSAIRSGINQTRAIGGQAPLPDFRGGPPPFDPAQFPMQAAQSALGVTPNRFVLPGAPPPVAGGQYVLPG